MIPSKGYNNPNSIQPMKLQTFFAIIVLSSASWMMIGCASKKDSGGGTVPTGSYSGSSSYSPLPMNQAARTDAMRQAYRNEFR